MSVLVEAFEDVVGGVVEAFGDVVESVVDVVEDVGSAIDDYVIQPILDDPLTAIATVAAASFLGPGAATLFATSGTVGAGIAAGLANTAAGLVQGEDFDEAIKGGLAAGVGTWAGGELVNSLGGSSSAASAPTDALSSTPVDVSMDALSGNSFIDVPFDVPASSAAPAVATPSPIDAWDDFLSPGGVDSAAASAAAPATTASPLQGAADAAASSPLQSLNTSVPQVDMGAAAPAASAPAASAPNLPSFTSGLDTSLTTDYGLASGMQSGAPGLKLPDFTPADSFDIYGNPNYSLTPKGTSGGPGLQLPDAPNLAGMGGGQGLTADVSGLPEFQYSNSSLDPSIRGTTDTWTGDSGKTYGSSTPDVTIGARGATPTPQTITYEPTTNMGTPSVMDQLAGGKIADAAKNVGTQAVNWVKDTNPWMLGAGALAATSALGGAGGPPSSQPPPRGSTQDKNFNKSLDLYEYMRDKANYGGNLERYGQTGGEHRFFQNTRFVPIPIPGQEPKTVKMGGLIQMKHFAQGGMAQGMQDPRRAQLMAAMAQQHPAGQGGQGGLAGMAQGRPPMMQGGAMPQRQMSPQNAQGGLQGQRPQMPQRPRDPKMAYYQYGNPPVQAKAMGGLSQVHSMRIGGGADGRSDDVNAVLSDGEYVMDAESVAMLGNGSSKAGAAKLDQMRSKLRQHKGKNLASGKISPDAKSPLAYLKGA